jgi:hypothetical protein
MNRFVYGIIYPTFVDNIFFEGMVYPIEVLSCNDKTFVGMRSNGEKFQTSLKYFYEDEKTAWDKMYSDVSSTITNIKNEIVESTKALIAYELYLQKEVNFK